MAAQIRRDLYAEVTSRILAELERSTRPRSNHGRQRQGRTFRRMR